jgi:riboflavin biosynthesis pyrimidine reductase
MCDVLLVGAGTIRAEGYGPLRLGEDELQLRRERGQSEAPRLAVLSRHLDLDLAGAAFNGATARPILLTTEAASPERRRAAERVADVVVAGRDAVNLANAVELLAEQGLPQILSEGGPHVLAGLFAADLVDELCLALAPLVIGGRELRITAGDLLGVPSEMELSDVLEKDGYLFLRYRVQR